MRRSLIALLACVVAACGNSPAATPAPTATPVAFVPTVAPTTTPAPSPTPIPSPTPDPAIAILRNAADKTIAKRTVKFEQTVEFVDNAVVPAGTSLSASGASSFDLPRKMSINGDFSDLGMGRLRMIVDGDLLYMKGQFTEKLVKKGKWLLVDLASDDPRVIPFMSLTTGQNDTSLVLYFLYGATSPARVATGQTIHGIAATKYAVDLDLELAADLAPASVREAMLTNIAGLRTQGVDRTVHTEVWVGEDGLVHEVDDTYVVGRVGGGGTLDVFYRFSDFGDEIVLGLPHDEDVVDLLDVAPPAP